MKTIIIFSTKYGSVEKAALKLRTELQGEVELVNVKTSPDFDDFDVVVLAGSIYAGRVQGAMRKFIKNNLVKLREKKIALYICAGTEKENEITKYLQDSFTQELYDKAIAKANLGFEYDLKRFSFIEKLLVRLVGGIKESKSVFYDDKIKEFAELLNNI
ncbi:MAG: flavodoxin domain-containing protein [Candidatus Cloacimonetes bacterium]|nr:flavodoxin domain-containing protein [Candidatus Cloacimonadota bacterium]